MYPQSDGSLVIVHIDASKGFCRSVGTLILCDFCYFDLKGQLKLPEMAFDQIQTCLIFPLQWASFPIKIGRNAQWEHVFSMYFDDSFTICLIF